MALLFEHQIRTARAGGRNQHQGADLLLASRREHRGRAAFPVSGNRNPPRIDVITFGQPLHHRHDVVRVVLQRDRFDAAAALADAALVVAQHHEAAFGECGSELPEDWDVGDGLIAVNRAGSADQQNRGMPEPALRPAASSPCRRC